MSFLKKIFKLQNLKNNTLSGDNFFKKEIEYKGYLSQINELYNMYFSQSYGANIAGTIIDLRTVLICGDGISVIAKRNKTLKWINNFLKETKLNSSKLLSFITHSELEGKQLIIFLVNKQENKINLKQINYYDYRYIVETDEKDKEKITDIYYENDVGEKKYFPIESLVIVKTGGKSEDYINTPPKIASIIDNIKYADRAIRDLRQSNHHFGFPTPAVECKDIDSVKITAEKIKETNWGIGSTFVSTGRMYYPQPPAAYQVLESEIALNMKIISSRTGIPVHWLGWTDLMSNRATSHDLNEFIQAGTKAERLIWIDAIKNIIIKGMELSIKYGFNNALYDDEFEVDLPYISLEYIDRLASTWMPLQMNGVISMGQLRNKIPGIDPQKTKELIEAEKEDQTEENNLNDEEDIDND